MLRIGELEDESEFPTPTGLSGFLHSRAARDPNPSGGGPPIARQTDCETELRLRLELVPSE